MQTFTFHTELKNHTKSGLRGISKRNAKIRNTMSLDDSLTKPIAFLVRILAECSLNLLLRELNQTNHSRSDSHRCCLELSATKRTTEGIKDLR